MTTFSIVRVEPVYCQIRGGIMGSKYVVQPMTYFREDYAKKLAGRLEQQSYDNCGDDFFKVIVTGESPHTPYRSFAPTIATDDMPF